MQVPTQAEALIITIGAHKFNDDDVLRLKFRRTYPPRTKYYGLYIIYVYGKSTQLVIVLLLRVLLGFDRPNKIMYTIINAIFYSRNKGIVIDII